MTTESNAFVERYHRTYKQECLQVSRPSTLEEVRTVTEAFLHHYNEERPHQDRSCGNRPPRTAFPSLPALPALPTTVQPNRWLLQFHQHAFARRVGSDDCVDVDLQTYDVSKRLAGQSIALVVDTQERSFTVWQGTTPVALLPIKGLFDAEVLPFEQYAQMMQREAQSQLQRLRWQRRTLYQPSLWTFWSQLTRKQAERAQRETGSRTTSQCSFATLESLMLS